MFLLAKAITHIAKDYHIAASFRPSRSLYTSACHALMNEVRSNEQRNFDLVMHYLNPNQQARQHRLTCWTDFARWASTSIRMLSLRSTDTPGCFPLRVLEYQDVFTGIPGYCPLSFLKCQDVSPEEYLEYALFVHPPLVSQTLSAFLRYFHVTHVCTHRALCPESAASVYRELCSVQLWMPCGFVCRNTHTTVPAKRAVSPHRMGRLTLAQKRVLASCSHKSACFWVSHAPMVSPLDCILFVNRPKRGDMSAKLIQWTCRLDNINIRVRSVTNVQRDSNPWGHKFYTFTHD